MPFGFPDEDFYDNADELSRRLAKNAEAIKRLQAGLSADGHTCPIHGGLLNWLEVCPSCHAEHQMNCGYGLSEAELSVIQEAGFLTPKVSLFGPRHGRWQNLTPSDEQFLWECGISSVI